MNVIFTIFSNITFLTQAVHRAEVLQKQFEQVKQKVENDTKSNDYSHKALTREIVMATEVRRFYIRVL